MESQDTFSIVENTNQQIILQNILMLNQHKILTMVNQMFETTLHDMFQNITLSETNIGYIKEQISNCKFIDWTNFLFLINSCSTFKHGTHTYNSLTWIIETKSRNLLLFLLALEPDTINWSMSNPHTKTNVLGMIFICFADDDTLLMYLLNKIFTHNDFFSQYMCTKNRFRKTPVDYIIAKCSEQVILSSVKYNFIDKSYYEDLMVISCMYNWIELFKSLVVVHNVEHNKNNDLITKCVEESFYYLSYQCAVESLKYIGDNFTYDMLFKMCICHEWVGVENDTELLIKFLKLFSDGKTWCTIQLFKFIVKMYNADIIKYVLYNMIDYDELKMLTVGDVININMYLSMKLMSNEMCYINSFWFVSTCEYVKSEFSDCKYYLTGHRMQSVIYDE